jgi:hypothetical protein
MSNYLYCINFHSPDLYKNHPGVIHSWFENHPDDGVIEKTLDKQVGKVDEFTYFMVYDKTTYVPFVSEVEEFNFTFGKPNNYTPIIPERKEWEFVYNFILEELEEYKQACEKGDIVEVLDALCDITYVATGNGVLLHGLKDRFMGAYAEVQASNMSKACKTEEEAILTCNAESDRIGEDTHYEKQGEYYIVYRTRDRKVLKSIYYKKPNLFQFFTKEELKSYLEK